MSMSSEAIRVLEDKLESLGEEKVRRLLPSGIWGEIGSPMRPKVDDWLESKQVARQIESVSIAREAASAAREAVSVAREANMSARSANILLEPEQKGLIAVLVEAARNVPREQRQDFIVFPMMLGDLLSSIRHPGLPSGSVKAYEGDIKALAREGLLAISEKRGILYFFVTSEGFKYYEELKHQAGKPIERIEQEVKSFLVSDSFQKKYASAYQKWLQAESMLWASDTNQQLTTIGHLCREAVQEFASALCQQYHLPNEDQDKALTVARLKAVMKARASQPSSAEKEFLDALVAYWGTVNDLIQRQEHGSQKEGRPLVWEDGRRIVFQTAIVMFEIDKSLSRSA